MASQMRTSVLVLTSQKNRNANTSENSAPPRYSGRRPTRSDSAPYQGMVTSPSRAAMTTPPEHGALGQLQVLMPIDQHPDRQDVEGAVLGDPHAHGQHDLARVLAQHVQDRHGRLGPGLFDPLEGRGLIQPQAHEQPDADQDGAEQERDPPAPGQERRIRGGLLDDQEHHRGQNRPAGTPIWGQLPKKPRRPGGAGSTDISTAPPHSPPTPMPWAMRRVTRMTGAQMPIAA